MGGFISLVIFTILGQAAAGLALTEACSKDTKTLRTSFIVIVLMLIAGALASLGHLSDKLASFFTITNATSSWLSREILGLGFFGVTSLLCALRPSRGFALLAAFAGLVLVGVMGQVYRLPSVPFWNSAWTGVSFYATSLLLGTCTLLLIRSYSGASLAEQTQSTALGGLPFLLGAALALRACAAVVPLFHMQGAPVSACLASIHITLVTLGVGIGLTAFLHSHVCKATHTGETTACCCGKISPFAGALFAAVLIWAGEITGRVMFYEAYTWFGM